MPKAYQNTTPFDDPEKEKKRQNAIKAKEARDLKKAEFLALKKTIEKLERKTRKQRKYLDHYKIILKSHNIKNPVEDFDDEDMEIISGSETVSTRYDTHLFRLFSIIQFIHLTNIHETITTRSTLVILVTFMNYNLWFFIISFKFKDFF